MMPFVPFVRVKNVDEAIDLAIESEHGYRHTAHHPLPEPRHDHEVRPAGEHDAVRRQRRQPGGPGPRRPRVSELQHRDADRRRHHDAADVHAIRGVMMIGQRIPLRGLIVKPCK